YRSGKSTRYFNPIKHLDLITHFHVVVLHADTTFHPGTNFVDVVFEATQRLQLALEDHHVVAQNPDRLVPLHHTFLHHTAGHLTELGRTEGIPDLSNTNDVFAILWRQHPRQRLLDVFDDVVDHAVVTQIQPFTLHNPARTGVSTDVKADDHGVGCQCQVDVSFGNSTHAASHDLHLDLIVAQLAQGADQSLKGTAYVGLEYDIEHPDFVLAHVLEQVL